VQLTSMPDKGLAAFFAINPKFASTESPCSSRAGCCRSVFRGSLPPIPAAGCDDRANAFSRITAFLGVPKKALNTIAFIPIMKMKPIKSPGRAAISLSVVELAAFFSGAPFQILGRKKACRSRQRQAEDADNSGHDTQVTVLWSIKLI